MTLTPADVDKLRRLQVVDESVLSLYLNVASDPADLRELPARVHDLLAAVHGPAPDGRKQTVSPKDRDAARDLVVAHGREWLGHAVGIFVCEELGLAEALALRCAQPERAVLATRPYVRPLLAALQRCPAYRIAIIDRRHAWLLAVAGDRIETLAKKAGSGMPSAGFGGWHGLETYGVQQRAIQLARHHYRETAVVLDGVARVGGQKPLVLGGHADSIKRLIAELPAAVRQAYVGSFVADTHLISPARAGELADQVIARWGREREQKLADAISQAAPDERAAVGLTACLAAVNADAVETLLVADEPMVPGCYCARCGALSMTGTDCPDWGAAARAVPDLLEEMALRTSDDGGEVIAVREAPFAVAARLRYQVKTDGSDTDRLHGQAE
jgi:peptide chain release factor subunit 1